MLGDAHSGWHHEKLIFTPFPLKERGGRGGARVCTASRLASSRRQKFKKWMIFDVFDHFAASRHGQSGEPTGQPIISLKSAGPVEFSG